MTWRKRLLKPVSEKIDGPEIRKTAHILGLKLTQREENQFASQINASLEEISRLREVSRGDAHKLQLSRGIRRRRRLNR